MLSSMSTDPPNNAPREKWFRFTCFKRSRARQPRGQHPAVATGRPSSQTTAHGDKGRSQPGAKGADPGSQSSPSPPVDKEAILQWTKITLKMSEKVLGMVPVARLDKIPSLLLEFLAIYEVMHDALRSCSSCSFALYRKWSTIMTSSEISKSESRR